MNTQNKIVRIPAAVFAALNILVYVPHAACQVTTISVSGAANIFGAGHFSAPGGGLLPPSLQLPLGSNQHIKFISVTGLVSSAGVPFFPEGSPNYAPTDVSSTPSISGIIADRTFFLTGVFLEENEPTNPSPARLDFSTNGIGRAFTLLSPAIAQTFYIGDGLTSSNSGAIQMFAIPPTATRLFLGVVDAWDGSTVHGVPGAYQDNGGSYEVQVEVVTNSVSDISDLVASIHFSAVDICWAGRTNQLYQVQYRTNLSDTNWFNLGTSVIGALTNCVTDSIEGTQQRFYRIMRLP